jgi:decaprenyl-phosphate phosphoribosyltransferase
VTSAPLRQDDRDAEVIRLPVRRSRRRAALTALRPTQWTKNLLLFAGLVFAAQLGGASSWAAAVAAFVAYCAASSAAYVLNDVRDVEADRAHPLKRSRPLARGELTRRTALLLALLLAGLALGLALILGPASLASRLNATLTGVPGSCSSKTS